MPRLSALLLLALVALTPLALRAQDMQPAEEPKEEDKPKVEPVDFRKLKELLPETLGPVKRSGASGQKQAMGDLKLSMAEGEYERDEPGSGSVTITDYGAMPQMAEGVAAWAKMEIDNEGDDGYQKTVKIGEYPALEEYNKENKHGSLTIFVGERFLVQIEVDELDPAAMQETAKAMKLADLAALK